MPSDRILSPFSWLSKRWWIFVVAVALALAGIGQASRVLHVNYVSSLAGGEEIAADASSPTGYDSGARRLIIPERNAESYQWIMQVQEMLAEGNWRLRRVDYDNAPEGRHVGTASAYRWWLSAVAWLDRVAFGSSEGLSVERAALVADPILQALVLLAASLFIARFFNGWAAALFAVGFACFFPLGGAFAAGQPGDSALLIGCAIGAALPLLAGLREIHENPNDARRRRGRRLFFAGGIFGGLGMWISVAGQLPILIGIAVAGLIMTVFFDRWGQAAEESIVNAKVWRYWAFGGATAILLAWLLDRAPELFDSESWRPEFIHPLHALAWIGAGEMLVSLSRKRKQGLWRTILPLLAYGLPILGLLYLTYFGKSEAIWSVNVDYVRLTRLGVHPGVSNFSDWLNLDGSAALIFATLAPSAMAAIGIWAFWKRKRSPSEGRYLILSLTPVAVLFVLSFFRLGWWNQLDALILVLAVFLFSIAGSDHVLKWCVAGIVIMGSLIGGAHVFSGLSKESRESVNLEEFATLVERYMSRWLAMRTDAPGQVVLAPPSVSVSLAYYGGFRVLGTPYPENVDGFAAAVRLCAASTADEARALANGREVEFVVHPSWDLFLEEYAKLGSNTPEQSFIANLKGWLPPRWLAPVSFHLPSVQGFEDEWVIIFRTTEMQDNVTAISRLVEYFLDTGRGGLAIQAQKVLANRFPDELLVSLMGAEIAIATGDRAKFQEEVQALVNRVGSGAVDYLDWDLRISLAMALTGAQQMEEARQIIEGCVREANEHLVRRLSEGSISGMLRLAKIFNLEFHDPSVRKLALSLIPEQQRVGL